MSIEFVGGLKVRKNPSTWQSSDFDRWGAGVGIGVIVGRESSTVVDVRWPTGRCFQKIDELLPAEGPGIYDWEAKQLGKAKVLVDGQDAGIKYVVWLNTETGEYLTLKHHDGMIVIDARQSLVTCYGRLEGKVTVEFENPSHEQANQPSSP